MLAKCAVLLCVAIWFLIGVNRVSWVDCCLLFVACPLSIVWCLLHVFGVCCLVSGDRCALPLAVCLVFFVMVCVCCLSCFNYLIVGRRCCSMCVACCVLRVVVCRLLLLFDA